MKNHRILIGIAAVIAVWVTYLHSMQYFEQNMLQWFSRFIPSKELTSSVAVIAIDDKSIKSIGKWPWNYHTLADLIRKLNGNDLKSIGLLLPLEHSENYFHSLNTEQLLRNKKQPGYAQTLKILKQLDYDASLGQALKDKGNVVLPVFYELPNGLEKNIPPALSDFAQLKPLPLDEYPKTAWIARLPWLFASYQPQITIKSKPQELFVNQVKSLGLLYGNADFAGDGGVLAYQINDKIYPTLITQMAVQIEGGAPQVLPGYGVKINNNDIATDSSFRVFPKPSFNNSGTLKVPLISAEDILQNNNSKKLLKGFQAVIVGFTAQQNNAKFKVYGDIETNHAIWTAYGLNALINDQLLKQSYWSLGVQRLLIIVFAIYLLLLPAKLRGWMGFAITTLVVVIAINACLLLLSVFNIAQPLVIPAIFVLLGHFLLTVHHKISSTFKSLQLEAANAYRELGANLQAQGRLDEAFNYMRKSSMDKKLIECLYNLGLEFERRRQFNQAVAVYDYIAEKDANYRDIQERRVRHQTQSNRNLLTASINPHTATLVVDHPNVEQPVLGRYQIERILGQGAMGTVYLGVDPKISRTVAIKTLPLSDEFDGKQVEEVRRRFFREAETAGRLNHPNIVTIFDVGEEHDLAYIAMDYIVGEGLDCYGHSDALLSIDEVFNIGITVAEALDYAHQQNVVHRDIKPGNIMYDIETGNLKITDFGIACLTDNTRTRTGTVLGSPSYMSPEQLSGEQVDGRSDIYSLGITLYQLFTGVLPFMADSMASLAYMIANTKPKGIRKIRPELPACLTRVINKAIEKDPEKRYQTGGALADALRRCSK